MASYTWDEASGRYRDSRGRFVTQRAVRDAVDDLLDASTARMQALTRRLQSGDLDLVAWQQQMAAEIKASHLAAAMVAHGGRSAMGQSEHGWTGQRIREQYGYLRAFAQQVASGEQALTDQLVARAALYGQAGRSTYEAMRARDSLARGENEEINRLGAADHCPDCVGATARGWVATGTLIPIGQRQCRVNCRCRIERRSVAEPLQTWEDPSLRQELPSSLRTFSGATRRAVVVPIRMRQKIETEHAPDVGRLARLGELLRDWEYAGMSPTGGRLEIYGRLDDIWHTAVMAVGDPDVPVNVLATFHRVYPKKVLSRVRNGRIRRRSDIEEGT